MIFFSSVIFNINLVLKWSRESLSFADTSFKSELARGIGRTLCVILFLITENVAQNLFKSGKEYVFSYNAVSSTGVLVPSSAATSWTLNGELVIQAENDSYVTMQVFFFFFTNISLQFNFFCFDI